MSIRQVCLKMRLPENGSNSLDHVPEIITHYPTANALARKNSQGTHRRRVKTPRPTITIRFHTARHQRGLAPNSHHTQFSTCLDCMCGRPELCAHG
jgi:hypothetical protein